jgi:branched-chain amino acid transport system substrate-binding protein
VIGTVGSYTGPQSSDFKGTLAVLKAWVSYTNANGGIKGHPIKLVSADDQTNPALALSAVQSLVQTSHVIALVGEGSEVDSAWSTYIEQAGVPVVGGFASSSTFDSNPDFFTAGTTIVQQTFGETQIAKTAGVTKLGFLYCAEVAACQQAVPLIRADSQKNGLDLVYTASVSASAPNYAAQCLAAKDAGVDGLSIGESAEPALRIAESCYQQGYAPLEVGNADSSAESWLKTPAFSRFVGVSPDVPFVDTSLPATRAFHAAVQKYAPSVLTNDPGLGQDDLNTWAAGELFAAAAMAGNLGDNPTPAQVKAGLYKLQGTTLGGLTPPLTFTAGNANPVACYFEIGIQNGQFTEPNGTKFACPS